MSTPNFAGCRSVIGQNDGPTVDGDDVWGSEIQLEACHTGPKTG
jgi:hypothetical protein